MSRSVALCDEPRIAALVEAPLLEADRERVYSLRGLLCGQRREQGRVDSAREEHADRDIGKQVGANGIAEARTQFFDQLGLVVASQLGHGCRAGTRVTRDLRAAALCPHEQV